MTSSSQRHLIPVPGTLFPDETECIPTVIDNAFTQGLIDERLIGISFEPNTEIESTNGELTFGGIDTTKFSGDLNFVYGAPFVACRHACIDRLFSRPITTTAPANEFVGIDQSVTYGAANTPILATTAGITDTGTTLLLLATG